MPNSFTFSKTLPSNSIINPNVESFDYLDAQSPFTFFDFLKYTKIETGTQQINDLYLNYLKEWNEKKGSLSNTAETIKTRYVELLKEITLKYTTSDEKRFLSNIDFNDPSDLDIILPFYAKKINEICNFYAQKREKIKFKIEKNKSKGTSSSLERAIFETITDVIFSDVFDVGLYQKNINYTDLIKNLNIEVEDLYDLYTSYLDNDPDTTYETYDVKTKLRQDLYSANINKISANIFLDIDSAIAEQIFDEVVVFLTEFGKTFSINYDISNINLNCKPDDKLYNLVTETKPKSTRLVELRNSLIKKYIGSDYYYITTGSTITDVTSGVLFKADNPSGNLLNRHFPTTATVEEESELHSLRKIGIYFTPDKNSILYYSVPEKKYTIDESKLEPDKLYIFPDPELYGNTIGLKRTFNYEYPLIHICDYTKSVKNYSNGYVEGDIKSTPLTQDYYPYFSKSQVSDKKTGELGLTTNFSSIYNKGIITEWAVDIYGNQFSLFKSKKRKKIIDKSIIMELSSIICEKYDGGPIKFSQNGFLPEEVLASYPEWVKPNIWSSNYYYNILIEGGVGGFYKNVMERGIFFEGYTVDGLIIDRENLTTEVFDISFNDISNMDYVGVDGLTFTDTNPLSFEWDLNYSSGFNIIPTYDIDSKYYVRTPENLIINPSNVLDGNILGNISEYKPSFNNNYLLSSIKYKDFDAGTFSESCEEIFDFEIQTDNIIKQIHSTSTTLTSVVDDDDYINSFEIKKAYGSILVRDVLTGEISDLSACLFEQFESKYNDFKQELYDKVVDFNVYNDFLWIRTENNLIFENRSYCLVAQVSVQNELSNNFYLIPNIYKVNYDDCSITKITNLEPLSSYKNDPVINSIKIRKVNKPFIFFNSRNNKYCVICIVEDINELAYIYKITFDYNEMSITNQKVKLYSYLNGQQIETINFYDSPSLDGLLYNSSGQISFNQSSGEMILE